MREARNKTCSHCGSYRLDYRSRTHDYKCHACRGITQLPPRTSYGV